MFTTLISDFGSVLTYPQDKQCVEAMLQVLKVTIDVPTFITHYTRHRYDYDAGKIDSSLYWQNLARSLNSPVLTKEQITRLADLDIRSWFNINFEMIEFLKKLKPLFKHLVLLSNINYDCVDYLERTCAWLAIFDIKVYSCYEKVMKPEKAIYTIALARCQSRPQECIFIDDNPDNIKSSRELGIEGLLFSNPAGIKAQLGLLNLLSLT
jgi:HAD superfamily hydrolase (TIGR01509 family)